MSYSTLDRYLNIKTTYAFTRGGPGAGQGKGMWWPDFGPGQKDFSAQKSSHPSDTIFENVVEPGNWNAHKVHRRPEKVLEGHQIRHPAPSTEALYQEEIKKEDKLRAHEVNNLRGRIIAAEKRQKRIDSWAGEAPIRMAATQSSSAMRRSRSDSSMLKTDSCSQVSRDVYERHGFLVGRHKGSIADGKTGVLAPRRHNPLSMHTMMYSGEVVNGTGGASASGRVPRQPHRYVKQWQTTPERQFKFDPKTFLPVPRGGWNSQPPQEWPEIGAEGNAVVKPVTFDTTQSLDGTNNGLSGTGMVFAKAFLASSASAGEIPKAPAKA
eukprot:TRINITY_DN6134_c5_g1_i1.p1 TRINITY_DN6134_c5_g1~~TRINITY_DN6134_c5_g1_i1.p1  ORF type:complete len:323 (+),score=49.21 TRINITY_DN6134_c5_g1_i1:202-1170(+)